MLLVTVISNYVAHYCFVKLYMSRLTSPHTIIKAIHRRVREGLTARLYAVTTRTSLPPATPQLSYISHAAPSYQLSTPIGTLQGQKRLSFATSYPRYTLGFGARTHGAHTLRILLPVPSKMKTTAGSITFALMHQCQPFQPLQGHRHRILEHRRQQPRREIPQTRPESRARQQPCRG